MAARKRRREFQDVDDELEVESASSSFRQAHAKRSRIAMAAENGGSVISDDESDTDDHASLSRYGEREEEDMPTLDIGVGGEEDDELDELLATQIVEKRMKEYSQNIAAEQGVIEEVFCRNFMCHSKLRIKLGPLINFIIGHNGSGKSAVLTALTMCLGGKATATNRGTNLKSLIKEGQESASLAVKIKNRGDAAYKPELYGCSIIVERNFSRNGTSGFKLKNADDKVISTKKNDLDDILDFFGFQLDNPINVLTQDMARQFLANSTPADKYKFFIRGTQLETLDNDYNLMEEHCDNMIQKLLHREEDIKILKSKMEQAGEKVKRSERMRGLRDKIDNYRRQHAWAQVEEQEEILRQYNRELEAAQDDIVTKEQEAEMLSGAYDGHDQAFEAAKRHIDQLKSEMGPFEAQRDEALEKFEDNTKELAELHTQERHMKTEKMKLNQMKAELERKISEEKDRIAGVAGSAHAERVAYLEELKGKVAEAQRELQRHHDCEADVTRAHDRAFRDLESAKPEVEEQQNKVQHANASIAKLQSAGDRPYDAYPPNMEHLVTAVDHESRWRYKPVGPMGSYVRLHAEKTKWCSLIEKTLAQTLNAFVVTNAEDQRMLRAIMKRVRCEVPIYIGKPTRLDPNGKEPHDPAIDTIHRVLTVDNDLVRNQLIIMHSIEQTCLIAQPNEAHKYMYGSSRPQNVKVAIAFAAERGSGIRYEWSRTGAAKSSPVNKWTGGYRIKIDREQQLRVEKEMLLQAERELDVVRQRIREKSIALKEAKQAVERFKRQAKELKTQVQRAEDAVEEQNNLIERNQPQDGRLQELERQLEETKADLEFSNASYQDAVNAKDDLNRKARAYKVALDAAQAQVDACGRRVAHAEEQMQRAATSRHDALRQKNEALAAIDCAKNLVTELQERRDEQQAIVDEFANAARTIASDRVPVDPGMNPHRLNTKIESLLRDLEKAEKAAGGTSEQLRQAFLQAKLEYTLAEEQFLSMKNVESVSCIFNFCGGSPTDASRRRLRKHWIIDVQDGSGSEDSSHSERAACFAIFSVNATSAVISDSITVKKYLQSM